MRRGRSTTYICTSTLPEAHQPTNTIGKNDDSRSKQENNRTHPLDDRRDRTYARPDARTRVATPDAAATIVRGSVLPSSLPAMVPVGSAPPPAIGERLFVLVASASCSF